MKHHDRTDQQAAEHKQNREDGIKLNFDIRSHRFHDPDLEMAVRQLPQRDQLILILRLMGHTQRDIAEIFSVSRSMISKKLIAIKADLKEQLSRSPRRG